MNSLNIHATAKLDKWWKPKASNLLAILYWVLLVTKSEFSKTWFLFIPSVITILGIGSFGHFINDWCDIGPDIKAGKNNSLMLLTFRQKSLLIFCSLVVALLPWIILPFDRFSILLFIVEFGFLLAYALPPIRLKGRKVWALFADSAYAYAIPVVLAAYTFFLAAGQKGFIFFLCALFLWQLAYGIRHYLNHLAIDRRNDIITHTHTLASQKGNAFVHQLIGKYVLPMEALFFISFLINIMRYNVISSVTVMALFVLYSFLPIVLTAGRGYSLFAFRFSKTTLDSFYQNVWPLVPLFFLILNDHLYGLLLFLHGLLFYDFLLKGIVKALKLLFYAAIYLPAAPIVFLKRMAKRQNQEMAEAKKETGNSPDPNKTIGKKSTLNIAVANINKQKYTETFIHGLLAKLKYNTYFIYGAELPQFDNDNRHFLSNWISIQTLVLFLETALGKEKNYFLKQSISNYLQTKKIQLVLAEFGPVGAELIAITKDIGIPLIVYFHGYDVFHKETVNQYLLPYKTLFSEASKIVAVSQVMVEELQHLGAPPEKLVHLPAYVNLDLFSYSDHSKLPARFLAVGRFSETKSPHLTILAFHKVVQQIPDASLTMIGKGGGGELFEACVILVKSLGIEDKVIFKGIISHEEVAKEMQQARVLVQHSLTTPVNNDREGKPVAIMEAMACGLPVIATQHSGIVELIEHETTGILVKEYDVHAMADYMLSLASNNDLVKCLGQKASAFIRNHSLVNNHVKILERLIDDCITQN